MHLQVMSQGQRVLVTSSLTVGDPELNRRPRASPFDVRNCHLWLAARFQIASRWVWVP